MEKTRWTLVVANLLAFGCQDVLGIDVVVGDPDSAVSVPDSGPDATSIPEPGICDVSPDVCGTAGTCVAQSGGYACECSAGYGFDGTTCVDIDECMTSPGQCDANAICRNTDGGFECSCIAGYIGDGFTCSLATSCRDVMRGGGGDDVHTIDPDGDGPAPASEVFCKNSIAGGGWQLISARAGDTGALFALASCLEPAADCSGTIPVAQRLPGTAPELLFATSDDNVWLRMTGLGALGTGALLDVITLARPLSDNASCLSPHYCGEQLDTDLRVAETSPNYTARFTGLTSQYSRLGGLWFGNGGGSRENHTISLNYIPYCGAGGIAFSDTRDNNLGNVVCDQPGAIYFRY